ncbi:MAG: zinc ribbon domain-containing protein [Marinospirillum sp.]|uniref:FmdB family zinc ribbon protein n=1 Tax=Marinospirillum sp. TaxID=2183934 RepID=UPI001A01A1E7|nr:FmdB family zinc ribbon protein [Marinospirillum sp.]MBE0508601.1 zinc ribbon domain-containing protein [Marinospirillum sp.]
MPIYEYQCQSCGHELEIMHKMSDAPPVDCPSCNEAALTRRISAAGFRLAGGGWYETDFKSGGSKKNLADSGGSAAGSGNACASCPSNPGSTAA